MDKAGVKGSLSMTIYRITSCFIQFCHKKGPQTDLFYEVSTRWAYVIDFVYLLCGFNGRIEYERPVTHTTFYFEDHRKY